MAPEVFATDAPEAITEVDASGANHVDPELWGQAPYQVVAWAMLLLILIMVWKKVPGSIVGGLDRKIADIRDQLAEAKALRGEAEALRDEYATKIAGAEKDAEAMIENARTEADAILARAEVDGQDMVDRRKRMAQDKIAAAERDALGASPSEGGGGGDNRIAQPDCPEPQCRCRSQAGGQLHFQHLTQAPVLRLGREHDFPDQLPVRHRIEPFAP